MKRKDLWVLVDGKLNVRQQWPGSQEGQPCPEGASGTALPAEQGRGLFQSALSWGGLTSSPGGSYGHQNKKKASSYWRRPQRW